MIHSVFLLPSKLFYAFNVNYTKKINHQDGIYELYIRKRTNTPRDSFSMKSFLIWICTIYVATLLHITYREISYTLQTIRRTIMNTLPEKSR